MVTEQIGFACGWEVRDYIELLNETRKFNESLDCTLELSLYVLPLGLKPLQSLTQIIKLSEVVINFSAF